MTDAIVRCRTLGGSLDFATVHALLRVPPVSRSRYGVLTISYET